MSKSTIARVSGLAVGAALVLGFASQASAVTIADLQAQIAALMAQLQSLQGGSSTASASFTRDLTVGSSGSDVSALQSTLAAQGYLTVSPTGFFGALTKAAVMKWQAAAGLPSTGFFGPLSRAKFSGSVTGGTVTGGTTTGGTVGAGVTGSITTPGAEGTLSVTAAPVSLSTVYDNDQNDPVLAFNAKATGSDIAIQRVKIDLGLTTTLYNKVISNISLVDDQGRVLAASDTNSTTVVKDSDNRYYVTLSGFSSIVARGSQRTFTVKASIRSTADSAATPASFTIRLAANGVRAIDGAGIDLYSPTNATDVTRTFTVSAALADSASLTVSTDSATPLSQELVASTGSSNNQADNVPLLVFDIKADKDDVKLTDLIAAVTPSGGTAATASTTYLYAGNGVTGSAIASASLSGSAATFNNMAIVIPKGTTKTFTLAADIRSANSTQTTFAASITANTTNVIGTNSNGDTVTSVSGSATGNNILVRNIGPVFSLVGTPSIARNAGTSGIANGTSTATATFQLHIKALGGDILFGDTASTTYPFVSNGTGAPARSFTIYLAGASSNPLTASTSEGIPTSMGGVTIDSTNHSFTVQQNNEVTIPVTFYFEGRLATGALLTGGTYSVALERINWISAGTTRNSTFMAGRTEWRTPSIAMP